MPKKRKGTKKEGKKEKSVGLVTGKDAEKKQFDVPASTEKEQVLKQELDELNSELDKLKKQVGHLRMENEWLQKEAEVTREESQDYQTYVSRKAQKRQSLIVTLSDHNQQELKGIQQQREELVKDYEEKKTGLTATLLEKENELSKINSELKKLEPYKDLQQEQGLEIQQLERELEEMRFRHENRIRGMKTAFLKERNAFEDDMETKIKAMADDANKQASDSLKKHTQQIKLENQRLRSELQVLIDFTNDLQVQKKRLGTQYQSLLQEHQFNHDLQQLRGSVFRGLDGDSELNVWNGGAH